MNIELITIGDELLDGRTRDLNIHWLGGRLRAAGVVLDRVTMVDDTLDRLVEVLKEAAQRADLVITSGGLGPTLDDRTREAIAEAAGVARHEHPEARAKLEAYFQERGVEMAPTNLRQAQMPVGAQVFTSRFGTADAFETKIAGTPCFSLPGVPFEFQGLVEQYLMPRFANETPRAWRSLHVFGKGESSLAQQIEAMNLPDSIRITWKAMLTGLTIEFSTEASEQNVLEEAVERVEKAFDAWVYRAHEPGAANAVAEHLSAYRLSIATAESCTGGMIASSLTDIPGSSAWFNRGYVTYSNDAKATDLGVQESTLKKFGAVSQEVAIEMARGARLIAQSDIAVAVSGIAGPGGGSVDKPVGTVMLACSTESTEVTIHARFDKRSRGDFKALVTELALVLVLRTLQNRAEILENIPAVKSITVTEVN